MSKATARERDGETCVSLVQRINRDAQHKQFQENRWGLRHTQAWISPCRPHELAIKTLIEGLAQYADASESLEYKIAEDGFLGPYWLDMLKGVRGMLNGETGRFDCGTLDGLLIDLAARAGYDVSDL